MPYPTKGLQEYMLKSDFQRLAAEAGVIGPPGPPGANGPSGAPGSSGTAGANGAAWSPSESPTSPATATGDTITTFGVTVSRVAPITNVTGVILSSGLIGGQQVVVLNESGFSVTFAASGTSHVASGTTCVIPPNAHLQFVWSSGTSLWYPSIVGSPPVATGGVYDTDTYDLATYG